MTNDRAILWRDTKNPLFFEPKRQASKGSANDLWQLWDFRRNIGMFMRWSFPLAPFLTALLLCTLGVGAAATVPGSQAEAQRSRNRISFVLNGRVVPEPTFQATLRRLVLSRSPRVSERIVNEDGSHGGHGKTYDARDPNSDERWLYMEVTLRDRQGRSRISRVLRRARR